MKKFYVLLFVCICVSCNFDNIPIDEQNVRRYEWLVPFLDENITNFIGYHNVDTGLLNFSYQIEKVDENYFPHMDSVAKNEKWELTEATEFHRKYAKYINHYETYTNQTIMSINIDVSTNQVSFFIE